VIDLTIVIVNYNGADYIAGCIESINNSQDSLEKEIVIIDNKSQDSSLDVIKSLLRPNIRLICNKENVGFSAANNQGIKIANGKFVFLLNNDTILKSDCLQILKDYFETEEELGGLAPQLLNEDETIQFYGSVLSHWRYRGKKPVSMSFLSGAAFFTTKSILDKIGGLDENFFFYNEDIDLCMQIKKLGLKLIYYPPAKLIHYGGKATATRKAASIIEGYRGGLYLVSKHYPKWVYQLYKRVLMLDVGPRLMVARLKKNEEYCHAYKSVIEIVREEKIIGRVI